MTMSFGFPSATAAAAVSGGTWWYWDIAEEAIALA
jgi:hypothetical protein